MIPFQSMIRCQSVESFGLLVRTKPSKLCLSLSSALSWEQRKNQMDAVCFPLFPTATCSSNIFSHFLDLFDILGSPQPTSSSHTRLPPHPFLSAFTEPASTSPPCLPAGGPS